MTGETTASDWVPKEKVLDLIKTPAIRTRYKAFLEYSGDINYMAYKTKPEFKIEQSRTI